MCIRASHNSPRNRRCSRVYGGIHYQFDSDASKDMGMKIGDFIFANYMVARR